MSHRANGLLALPSFRLAKFAGRFWAKVTFRPRRMRCWEWNAAVQSAGYGHVGFPGKHDDGTRSTLCSHQVAYVLAHGPIPDGMNVLHRCHNEKCVNPRHLYVGAEVENARDRATARMLRVL